VALPVVEGLRSDDDQFPPLQAETQRWLIRINGRLGHFEKIRELALDTVRYAEPS